MAAQDEAERDTPSADRQAREIAKKKPALNFQTLGIPAGTLVTFAEDAYTTAIVRSPKKVQLADFPDDYDGPGSEGELLFLTPLTTGLRAHYADNPKIHDVRPAPLWTLDDGRTLLDVFNDFYR